MSIVCSGYVNNTLLFITKENELHSLGSSSQPLSNITGYPNTSFDGLCSYSPDTFSMYLSFTSENNSTIYQLHLNNPPRFSATPTIVLPTNTTLHSFAHIVGRNDTQTMAYITTQQDQRLTFTLQNLNNITQQTSKPIQERAVLTASGSTLYVIESHFIEQYRFDSLDYCSTPFISNINDQTSGTIITGNINQYIALYQASNSQLDIYKHDTLLSNYTTMVMSNGFVNLSSPDNNATQVATTLSELSSTRTGETFRSATTVTASANSHTVEGSEVRTRKHTTTTATTETAASSATPLIAINGESKLDTKSPPNLLKRSITPEQTESSPDGSYTVQKTSISSEEDLPVVMAILDPSDDVMQDPPYNILVLAGDSAQGYHFYNYSGSSLWHPDARGLSGGTIAGIVIGIIAFIALVLGALWYTKKRKNDKNSVQRTYRSMPVSSQPTDAHVATSYMTSVNHSQTSSILIETGSVPDEYRDSSRPDIRPLTYYGTHIKYAELSNDELQALEPDVAGPLYLFSGKYTSGEEEKVTYLRDGYAIRTFVDADDGIKHTIHYFSASNLKTFVRSVNAVLSCTKSQYIMKSKQGIVLCKPTPRFNYQYIWITSPMIPEHSLYYLLFERKTWTFVDHHNPDYKIWSIYAVLKSVETLHASKFVHLAIDLKAFYYDDETKATDWRLGNFGYAQPTNGGQKAAVEADAAPHTAFTAPEVIRNGSPSCHHGGEASDVWSVACVIYTIATGGGLLFENDTQVKNLITFNDDMKQHLKISVRDNIENQVFKSILQDMLQVDPTQRKSIAKVLDDWNLIYNMEE